MEEIVLQIAIISLVFSLVSLVWNIIRDIILDSVSVELHIIFGEIGNIRKTTTSLFAEAGSLKPEHKFDNTGMLVKIINIGRRPIVICGVGGELKNGSHFFLAVADLPKMLEPYEEFSHVSDIKNSFMDNVKNNEVKKLWATDTKGKKWLLSEKGLEKFKKTAEYINSGKNL